MMACNNISDWKFQMSKIFFVFPIFFLVGCANLDYAKNLSPDELLFDSKSISKNKSDKFDYKSIGSDRLGFVGIDSSEENKKLDEQYPIQAPDPQNLDALHSHNHRMRLGQALVFIADIDPRTSGFLKDSKIDHYRFLADSSQM